MKTRIFFIAWISLYCGLWAASVDAGKDFYKWVDDDGTTHYSEHPPTHKDATKVRTSNLKTAAAPKPAAESDQATTEASEPQGTPPITPEPYKKSPELCETAKKNLKVISEHARIRLKDGDEYRYLTQEEIAERKKEAQEQMEKNCP